MATHEALDTLRSIPLFSSVSDDDLEQLASHLIERRFPRNTTIVEEGLAGDYMYVMREGRVKVTKLSEDGREKILDFFDAGNFFGDMSLFDQEPRSATVVALERSELLTLHRRELIPFLEEHPRAAIQLAGILATRLRRQRRRWYALRSCLPRPRAGPDPALLPRRSACA